MDSIELTWQNFNFTLPTGHSVFNTDKQVDICHGQLLMSIIPATYRVIEDMLCLIVDDNEPLGSQFLIQIKGCVNVIDIQCAKCEHFFEGREWHPGKCPQCGNEYTWDEQCTEDYSDCWSIIDWKEYMDGDTPPDAYPC